MNMLANQIIFFVMEWLSLFTTNFLIFNLTINRLQKKMKKLLIQTHFGHCI